MWYGSQLKKNVTYVAFSYGKQHFGCFFLGTSQTCDGWPFCTSAVAL